MGKAACDAARAVGYVGAGTVEFIADSQGNFYFMEMNTRLQVEHPVTEMITGLDLVEWQLRVAAGEDLPLTQEQVPLNGHSIEVRIYAEEPEKGFLPSVGRLAYFKTPAPSAHVRLDTGVEQGDEITPHYDPMIAKLIVWDRTREAAIERMLGALAETRIVGVGHNVNFLSRLVGHAAFREGRVDTGLDRARARHIDSHRDRSCRRKSSRSPHSRSSLPSVSRRHNRALRGASPMAGASMARRTGRCSSRPANRPRPFRSATRRRDISSVTSRRRVQRTSDSDLRITIGQRHINTAVVKSGEQMHVFLRGQQHVLTYVDPLRARGRDAKKLRAA